MISSLFENMAQRVMNREFLTHKEALSLAQVGPNCMPDLLYWANQIRLHFWGRRVSFCSIAPGRQGGCDQDCAWCGQSDRFSRPMQKTTPKIPSQSSLLTAACRAKQSKAACFCVVTSGRKPVEQDIRLLEELNLSLNAKGMVTACASMGELDQATARRLRAAGVKRYNHNLETSRSYFGRVVTTHNYDDRLKTLRIARSAGMRLCCGGIFGIGESWDDRIEMAFTLRDEIKPDVIPLNFLDARPGTPMADTTPLTPLECLRIIAMFRFILPTTNIKIAGGRRLLRDLRSWVFHAGATSLMVGDYLTTQGREASMDTQMVSDLGLELISDENVSENGG